MRRKLWDLVLMRFEIQDNASLLFLCLGSLREWGFFIFFLIFKIYWYTNRRVMSFELWDIILTSCICFTSYKLQITFIARVTSYFYIRVTSFCSLHELGVTFQLWITTKIKIMKMVWYWCYHKELLFEIIFW